MNNCVLCSNIGKQRKYFFKNKPLCDTDYISYLEFLIKDMNEEVTTESASDAFAALEISLKPEPTPKPIPKPYDDESYNMSIGM